MSLDVYLYSKVPVAKSGTGVFFRENGEMKELTQKEVFEKFGKEILLIQDYKTKEVFWANITHNLNTMAEKAGIYQACWRPEEINCKFAKDIIPLLKKGLEELKSKPDYFKQFDAENGWGTYKQFVPWVEKYLKACEENPDAIINVSR